VAKVKDFGYSSIMVNEGHSVLMPKTVPWNAPEHHHRGFSPQDAKRMDIYSFGLLCLWILFEPGIRNQVRAAKENAGLAQSSVDTVMKHWLESATRETGLLTTLADLVQTAPGLSMG
jgi:serine/threonine protein kinase